jgi:hypothetical protein
MLGGLLFITVQIIATIIMLVNKSYFIAVPLLGFDIVLIAAFYSLYIKENKPVYPINHPSERDVYFPFSDVPRPIYKDFKDHPDYFKEKEKTNNYK